MKKILLTALLSSILFCTGIAFADEMGQQPAQTPPRRYFKKRGIDIESWLLKLKYAHVSHKFEDTDQDIKCAEYGVLILQKTYADQKLPILKSGLSSYARI